MLRTTDDMYRATIEGTNKHRTGILTPAKWNMLINLAQTDYCRDHIVNGEVIQKRIDDLRMLYIVDEINPITTTSFPLPDGISVNNSQGVLLPLYMRLLSTAFKINYVNNVCKLTGLSDWIYNVKVLKSDNRNIIKRNPFRRPSDAKIYQRQIGNTVVIDTGTSSTAALMHIEYFKWPVEIFFNENNIPDTGNPLTGSVNCELPPEQRQEIVDYAVRVYIERSQDPRYRTILNEEQITGQSK
jgi:hypothetical protein